MRKSKSKKNENGASFTEEDDEPLANVASPPSEDYEVECIVGVRKRKGQTEYQVRWKGYAADADTWEPEDQLSCQELIDAFNKSPKKGKPGRKRKGAKPTKTETPKKSKGKVKKEEEEDDEADDDNDDEDDDDETEYEVEKIIEVQHKRGGERVFLVRWKGYSKKDDSWQPEDHLNCPDLIAAFMKKVDKGKSTTARETRINRKKTEHYRVPPPKTGRTHKRRKDGPRKTYNEDD